MVITSRHRQRGSVFGLLIGLVVLGYAVYIGIQYVPILIEETAVDSILDSIATNNRSAPATSTQDVQSSINKQLNLNQMDEMRQYFNVTRNGDQFTIHVMYERELDLLFDKKTLSYTKSKKLF